MRAVIQRVAEATVKVEGEVAGAIGVGLMVLLGVERGDTGEDLEWLCGKISRMRIFDDNEGVMNRDLLETDGEMLVISQFTLHASTKKGNRPSYIRAAGGPEAEPMYLKFIARMEEILGKKVARGVFGANMQVSLVNDGPVTIVIDSKNKE